MSSTNPSLAENAEVILFSPFSIVDMEEDDNAANTSTQLRVKTSRSTNPEGSAVVSPSRSQLLSKLENPPQSFVECLHDLAHVSDFLMFLLPPPPPAAPEAAVDPAGAPPPTAPPSHQHSSKPSSSFHKGSLRHLMAVVYLTDVFECTMGTPENESRMVFPSKSAKKACEKGYKAWQDYLADDYDCEDVRVKLESCARAARGVTVRKNYARSTSQWLLMRSPWSVLFFLAMLPVLVNWILILWGVPAAAQVPCYVLLILLPLMMRLGASESAVFSEATRRARRRAAMYSSTHAFTQSSTPPITATEDVMYGSAEQAAMNESNQSMGRSSIILTPQHVPREGLLFLQDSRGTVARLVSNDVVTNRLLIIGFNKTDLKIVYWSDLCEQVTGFSTMDALGNIIQTVLADEKSKNAIASCIKNQTAVGNSNMFVPGKDRVQLNLLSEVTVTVSVKFHVVESKDVSGTEDGGTLYLLGISDDNTGVADSCTKSYIQYTTQELKRTYSKLVTHLSAVELECSTTEQYQLSTEVQRLIDSLHISKIQTAVATWVSFSSNFVPHHLIGQVIEEFTPQARSRMISLNAHVSVDAPPSVYWDDVRLTEILSYLVQVALNHTPPGGAVRVSASRQIIGDAIALRLSVSDRAPSLDPEQLGDLIEQRVITGLDVYHTDLGEINELMGGDGVSESFLTTSSCSVAGKSTLQYDTGGKLARMTQILEVSGGKLLLANESNGVTFTIQIPCIRTEMDKSSSTATMEASGSTNTERTSEGFVPTEQLQVAVYEPSSVYYMGIAHFLWSRSHSVISCKDVDHLMYAIDERKPNVVMFDIDSVTGAQRYDEVRLKAEEYDAMFIVMSCTNQTQLCVKWVLKPTSQNALQEHMKVAMDSVVAAKQREAQVSMMRQLFAEHKACEWECGKCIGIGTFGEVYMATSTLTGGRMAVKIIPLDTQSPEIQARTEDLINEIDILRTMEHPNVIHYFYCERVVGAVNIFMEYASGGSLAQHMQRRKLSSTRIIRIITEVLEAVAYIHEMGIVHRDIKSANILLAGRRVKLADFGTATRLRNGHAQGTKGTMRWMAPEVLNSKSYDHMCDIWSVGCLLIEMITNEAPFRARFPNHLALVDHISNLPSDSFMDHGIRDAPMYLDSFLKSCLQVTPALRGTARTLLAHPYLTRKHSAGIGCENLEAHNGGGGPNHVRSSVVSLTASHASSSVQNSERSSRRPSRSVNNMFPVRPNQRESVFGQSIVSILKSKAAPVVGGALDSNSGGDSVNGPFAFGRDSIFAIGPSDTHGSQDFE